MKLDLSSHKAINQLYHPTGKLKTDFYERVYCKDNLNITKFVPILLKEWFYLVKRDGQLMIDYRPNRICDKPKLEQLMSWLWKGSFEMISHNSVNNQRLRFICKKNIDTKVNGDSIKQWTFGIITNGKRDVWIAQIIDSIRKQKVPNYEIIICGTYSGKKGKDIVYIPFNEHDDKGWITKKKNLIVKDAKYENICMLHDRMVLSKDWYKGMKKWGNCFENLGCRQLFDGDRVNDWIASHYIINNKVGEKFSFESHVDYRDWYPDIWFLGQLNIFKKSILIKNNLWWNESLYYGEREDYDFSSKLHKMGFIHRFNKFSVIKTLTNKYVNPTVIRYNPRLLEPLMELNNINALFKTITYYILKMLDLLGINISISILENIRGKIYTFILMLNPNRYSHNKEWRRAIK